MNYKIFGKEFIDQKTINQFEAAMAAPSARKGALMADAHIGYTMPIGGVIESDHVIFPSWVGYDIGCGVCAAKTNFSKPEIIDRRTQIFDSIYKFVPTGFSHRTDSFFRSWTPRLDETTPWFQTMFSETNGYKQIGTLGSGNHFIEIGYDNEDAIWIVVHSGSRNVGHQTGTNYMKIASGTGKAAEGNFGFHVDSRDGQDYIKDMNFCLNFALVNRAAIIEKVREAINTVMIGKIIGDPLHPDENFINRNHNHAELKDGMWIHRKGATHAESGMYGIIPGNMRDGSYITVGKGNQSSLFSSSHGAGRVMGRNDARKNLYLIDFKNQMDGITAKVEDSTIDESPSAYKTIEDIIGAQEREGLFDVVNRIKPIINVKA